MAEVEMEAATAEVATVVATVTAERTMSGGRAQ